MEAENELIKEIKKKYIAGYNYYEGEIYGQPFKIRMNKDHARNSRHNDDQFIHNLSLVSENVPSARIFRKSNGKFQWQIENIRDWEDAKEQILEFFYQIKDEM